jgi:1,4-dihydroxy-2-naphthoate polyprenyltransferase
VASDGDPLAGTMTRVTPVDVLQIVDIRTKIVSLSSLAIGTAYAAYVTRTFSPGLFALMLLATLCVDMGTTAFNSYYDFVLGVDTADTDVERWKALVQRGIDPAVARRIGWLMFALAAVSGLALGALVDWRVVAVGAACMTVALLYSGGPLPISRLPVGEVFAGGLLGLVLIAVAAFVQGGGVDARTLWLGVPSSTLIATILSVNNACDVDGDARAGRRTLAVVLGRERAARAILLQAAATLLLALALIPLGVLPVSALVPLALAAIFGARECGRMHRRGYASTTKAAAMGGVSAVFAVYTLAILVAIALGAVGLP